MIFAMPTIETTLLFELTAKYDALKADYDRLTREIQQRNRRIAQLEKEIAAERQKHRRR